MSINASTLDSFVPISDFNKGRASKIFERLRTSRQLVVLKNNKPTAVILSPEEYEAMAEAQENLYFLELAESRLTPGWEERTLTHEEFWADLGITEEDMANTPEPEIE